jgi:hypothetical protein
LAVSLVFAASPAVAQDSPPISATMVAASTGRVDAPFLNQLLIRSDRPAVVRPSASPDQVLMTFGVRHGETGRLAADLKIGSPDLFGKPMYLAAGLGFYHVEPLSSPMADGMGLRLDAWCAPDRLAADGKTPSPVCLLFRSGFMAGKGVQAAWPVAPVGARVFLLVPANDVGAIAFDFKPQGYDALANQNPLYVRVLPLGGGLGKETRLEPGDVTFQGDMTLTVSFMGRQGSNLAVAVDLAVRREGFKDADWRWIRIAPLLADGQAVFDLGGGSQLLAIPKADGSGAYAFTIEGPLSQGLAALPHQGAAPL